MINGGKKDEKWEEKKRGKFHELESWKQFSFKTSKNIQKEKKKKKKNAGTLQ